MISGRVMPARTVAGSITPSASPRMNAESMISNECVALPITSESMRIQPIWYANERPAAPAPIAAAISGNVIPRRTAGTKISRDASTHFRLEIRAGEPIAGNQLW